jgi:arylsulfatase K
MSTGDTGKETRRPNILFIQTDSQDGRLMGCMDHPAMSGATPNLDALARQGTLFRNTYSNNPVCCPSRASMWSGQFTHHCEAWNNYKGLDEGDPTFRTRLDNAGYVTQTFGKTDYLSGRHTVRARVAAWTRSASIMRPAYKMGPPTIHDDRRKRIHLTDWEDVDRSAAFLKERAEEPAQPFMLYLGIRAPHPGFTTSRRYLDMVDESAVDVPARDEAIENHPVFQYRKTVMPWSHGFDDEMVRKVRHVYFAMIAEVDAMVGAVLEALERAGLADSTVVLFTSDHGEMAMEHGEWYKMCVYEPAARVPFIAAGPGIEPGKRIDNLVSLVDVYPTLMDLAGVQHPAGLDGHSLVPLLEGRKWSGPDWALTEFHDTPMNTGVFMVRRGDWKYAAYVGFEPQLFNLAEDPGELNNLAAARPEITREMDALLRSIVDYEAVDAKVKDYDRRSFRHWRKAQKEAGLYDRLMARIYSGWDGVSDEEAQPWTAEDEKQIEDWLGEG